ncbi:MAG: phosphate/phosphite/phosphonate ABC transporter substrate-binding protein [Magnetospiraceae bacterium]
MKRRPPKRLILGGMLAMVAFLVGLAPPAQAQGKKIYTFGVVPQFEARKLAAIWVPILQALGKETGLTFEMVGSPQIPAFEKSFQLGEFDFAYMNPYHSVIAMKTQGYVPLVRDGSRKLTGILVVRKDSPYQDVQDLQGQKVAFPAPNALGASLLMRAELKKLHNLDVVPLYVQTHSSVYLNVLLGEAAAGGGVNATLKSQDTKIQDNLRVIYTTRGMAPHPVVAHPRVTAAVAEAVKAAFLKLAGTEEGKALLAKIPMRKAIPAISEDYLVLREWGLEDFYVE